MRNVVLIGFMGTGKTALAKALSRDLGKKYVSTDDLIEEREGRKINDIFEEEGEAYFRRLEKEVVKEVSRRGDQIVDAGGGVVLDEENMDNLKGTGIVICLWATPEEIWNRTKSSGHRPLLNVEDPMKRIRELLEYRRPYYEKADLQVDTTGKDAGCLVDEIKRIVHEREKEEGQA